MGKNRGARRRRGWVCVGGVELKEGGASSAERE